MERNCRGEQRAQSSVQPGSLVTRCAEWTTAMLPHDLPDPPSLSARAKERCALRHRGWRVRQRDRHLHCPAYRCIQLDKARADQWWDLQASYCRRQRLCSVEDAHKRHDRWRRYNRRARSRMVVGERCRYCEGVATVDAEKPWTKLVLVPF